MDGTPSDRGASLPVNLAHALHVVLKISERCNLVCPYCYFFFGGDESHREHPAIIPPRTLSALGRFLKQAVAEHGVEFIPIGFHGGEPLLMKKARFREMCDGLRAELDGVCRLFFGIQTNGVLIDEEWIDLFAEYDIRVSVSFDGPEEVHNRSRIDRKGRGTYAESRRGWDLLMAAAQAGRIGWPSILCVVDPSQDGREMFRHFAVDLGARGMNFLLPDITHDAPEATPEFIAGCGRYLSEVFGGWRALASRKIRVRFIHELVTGLADDQHCRHSLDAKHNINNLLTVYSNGGISSEDTLRSANARFATSGVDVLTGSLTEVYATPLWEELKATQTPSETCSKCEWWNVCKGGRQVHRYSAARGLDNPSVFCPALKRLHTEVRDFLVEAGYDGGDIARRLRIEPGEHPQPVWEKKLGVLL